ncbi:MAG: tagatose 1,6-diphosphate aldolase [Chloroflexi bacterium]|nr:tagatose 1,6-diphosphate aldolase [Chloroflexota bacterium]
MAELRLSKGKIASLDACADERGVITALAVDHRTPLLKAIAEARGPEGQTTAEEMTIFKSAVTRLLTPYASAILLDPEYSLEVIGQRAPGAGVLLAYEKTGYDPQAGGRLPDLLPEWSVRRLAERGASGVKILLYYNPFDDAGTNTVKEAFVERVGAECAALDVAFFLEPITYDDSLGDTKGAAFARKKPDYVTRSIEEFSRPRYGVDVLKVEAPVEMKFVSGTSSFAGEAAYTRSDALGFFRAASDASKKPMIYLSAGVSDQVFREILEMAAEAGAIYAGVLCGRATWQGGIEVYAREGAEALERWLQDKGAANMQALNQLLAASARPWWTVYGERDDRPVATGR